ncbi:MAG TPA: TonB-dependent receptor [Acidobacteriota bacterium]|nr:TonB-dependent receptor [Acidobacteriota bacterium]
MRKVLLARLLSVFVFVGWFVCSGIYGQTPEATLTGVVRDATGGVIPAAEATLTNQETGLQRLTLSDDEGRYLFRTLTPGTYTLKVTAVGFKTHTMPDIRLAVSQSARLDINLDVGETSQEVTVTGAAPLLQSEGAAVGSVISETQLTELPLNGRSFVGLAVLAPGASSGFSNNYQKYVFGKRAVYDVVQANGVRSEFTSTTIDGINTQTIDRKWTSVLYPSVDMLHEFKSKTANYKADTSGGGGVNLNVATKSGTNQFHGSVFEFAQNRALNARNFFLPAGREKPDEKYHQFGATIGGPILRNRTFFFFSYQGLRITNSFIRRTRVPTEKERMGDFSEMLAAGKIVRDPLTTREDPSVPEGFVRDPFPGNIIPSDRLSPIALRVLELGFPRPNAPLNLTDPTDPLYNINFIQTGGAPDDSNQFSIRIDHNLSESDSLFGRWTQERRETFSLGLLEGTGSFGLNRGYSGVIGWNHTFGPTIINELRLGYNRFNRGTAPETEGQIVVGPGGQIPLPGLENINPDQRQGLCCFRLDGLPSPDWGSAGTFTPENMYQIANRTGWTVGNHSIAFGGGVRRNEDYPRLAANLIPSWTFRSTFTGNPFRANAQENPTIATDFWLGLSDELSPSLQFFPKSRAYWYQHQYDLYVDDQIRVTPDLSVSVGLRYTYWQSLREKDNQLAHFDYATGEIVYPRNSPDITPFEQYFPYKYRRDGPDYLFDMPKANFQPSVSVAWSPWGPKTVIRGGYSRYHATPSIANLVAIVTVPPFLISGQRNNRGLLLSDAFLLSEPALPPEVSTETFSLPSLQLGDFNYEAPMIQSWNIDIQYQLTNSMVASIGYVGNDADDLNSIRRPNSPPPGPGAIDCDPPYNSPDCRRPYPGIGRIIDVGWDGISNYHGLQTNLTRRFSDGLMFNVSYAFGKTLGTVDELIEINGGNLNLFDPAEVRAKDYGRNSYDFRHIFRASSIWQVPVGRGQRFLTDVHPAVDAILGGWQLSGILTLQSGQAFSVFGGFNLNAQRTSRPDRICDGNLDSDQRTILRDIDTSCFVNQNEFRDGTAGRNILDQRSLRNLDLAIQKYFTLPIGPLENPRLQFRAEMFNATNTPFFAIPSASCCGSENFGRIFETERENRVIQMGLKLTF